MYLTQSLHRALQQHPDRLAAVFGDRSFTFAEHVDRVARFAGALQSLGLNPGDRVAMLSANSDRYLEYLAAVPWADGVLVPVNTRWSFDEIADSFDDCGVRILVVGAEYRADAERLVERCDSLEVIIDADGDIDGAGPGHHRLDALISGTQPVVDARRSGDALAAIFYTGGTTGRSKGVMLSHENLMVSALGCAATGFWASVGGVFLHSAPMFHLADLCQWAAQSLAGSTHVIVGGFDAATVLETVESHRVTDLFLVPTMIQMLLEHPDVRTRDLSSVRRFLYGASPIPPAVLDQALELFPDVALAQAYGMTELSPVATLLGPEDHRAPGPHRYSAGRAAPHSEVCVVDPLGNTVPNGTVGEICSRGGHVMLGYWKRPDETAAVIRDGWMYTGDLGYLDDEGFLFVVDRSKDMIVSGGENVYSAEVEKVLSGHSAVAHCVIVGVPDDTYGERVHAVIVPSGDVRPDLAEIREFVGASIARYKSPRSVSYVDSFPTSGAGKILKRTIRQQVISQSEVSPGAKQSCRPEIVE